MSHILVIDSSEEDCLRVKGLLTSKASHTVRTTQDHQAACDMLAEQATDAVLLDSSVLGGECCQFVANVRKQYPKIPIVIVASAGSQRQAIAALRNGASSYVPKSLLDDELIPTLREVLEYSRREKSHSRMMGHMTEVQCRFEFGTDDRIIGPMVGYVQDHLIRIGPCDQADVTRIGIALDEALVNALYHGNLELDSDLKEQGDAYDQMAQQRMQELPYCDRKLFVSILINCDVAEITIRDEGPGFDVTKLPDPTDPANVGQVSGRGVLLMRTFMDDVQFNETGNRVLLRKYGDLKRPCEEPSGD